MVKTTFTIARAGYLYHAMVNQLLVTEDETLRRKAREVGVEAITVSQLLSGK